MSAETVADILAEMRGPKFYPWGQGGFSVEMDLTPLADRIEAAQKREVGNDAKMREALLALDAWAKVVKNNPKDTTAIECAEFVEDTIKAALAAPPRNCDVGTPEEQFRRYHKFCMDGHGCSRCRVGIFAGAGCSLAWAQMPYEEGGDEDTQRIQ